ncbi:hypothetical protein GF378_01600 [Candidatus Pacearchaeota archaeon]|nr:hypothetical protein [Candidatus Pacearchaeota archaeon]
MNNQGKKRHILTVVILLIIFMSIFYLLNKQLTGNITLTGLAVQSYSNETQFNEGTYSNTEYSSNHVKLSSGQSSGNYTSEIFDSSATSTWNNISWVSSAIGDLPDNGESDNFASGNANMSNIWLLAHLDEASANSGAGGSDFEDTSGNDYHGNESGGVTFNVSGNFDRAVSFDGTDDAINFGDIEMDGTRDFSFSLWFKTSSTNDQMRLASKDQVGIKGCFLVWHSATFGWQFKAYEGSDEWAETSYNVDLSDGEWHHLVGKISKADSKIKLFVDGTLKDTDDFPGSLNDTENEEVVLGADSDVGSFEQLFTGEIDEFAIWNREISADEISDLYKRGITELDAKVRACDDANCSGESFEDIIDSSPQDLSLNNTMYLQYAFNFSTENTSLSPELYNVSIDYENVNSAPAVSIYLPSGGLLYLTNESLALNYTATDTDNNLDSCWYNIDNGENNTIASCVNTTFSTSEGSHTLYLYANDSNGSVGSDSVSFNVDPTGVDVTLVQPAGTKTSRTSIPLTYTTIGNNLSCWYEVKTSIGAEVISNTTLENCSNTTFTVSTDGDYVAYLYANNTLGSSGSDNSSFSVDTSSNGDDGNTGGDSGGSSGSGVSNPIQGGIVLENTTETSPIEVLSLSDLVARPGETKKLVLTVSNKGKVFLNDCVLKAESGSENENWINSETSGVKDLAVGEKHDFIFALNVPEDANVGSHLVNLVVECEEAKKLTSFNTEILDQTVKFVLLRTERTDENNIKIIYSLTEISGKEQDVEVKFKIKNSRESILWEKSLEKHLSASSSQELELISPLTNDNGDLKLVVEIKSDRTYFSVDRDLILSPPSSISGFFVWGSDSTDNIITIVIIAFFVIFAVVIGYRIFKNKSNN